MPVMVFKEIELKKVNYYHHNRKNKLNLMHETLNLLTQLFDVNN